MTITMPKWCAVLLVATINVIVPMSFIVYLWENNSAFSNGMVAGVCFGIGVKGLKNVWEITRKYPVSE